MDLRIIHNIRMDNKVVIKGQILINTNRVLEKKPNYWMEVMTSSTFLHRWMRDSSLVMKENLPKINGPSRHLSHKQGPNPDLSRLSLHNSKEVEGTLANLTYWVVEIYYLLTLLKRILYNSKTMVKRMILILICSDLYN